jgi:hypothetical protein
MVGGVDVRVTEVNARRGGEHINIPVDVNSVWI